MISSLSGFTYLTPRLAIFGKTAVYHRMSFSTTKDALYTFGAIFLGGIFFSALSFFIIPEEVNTSIITFLGISGTVIGLAGFLYAKQGTSRRTLQNGILKEDEFIVLDAEKDEVYEQKNEIITQVGKLSETAFELKSIRTGQHARHAIFARVGGKTYELASRNYKKDALNIFTKLQETLKK